MNTRTDLAFSALALLLGTFSLQALRDLPDMVWVSWLPLLLLLRFISPVVRLFALFSAGFLWALLHAHLHFSHVLPESLAGKEFQVTGYVSDVPQWQDRALRFDFTVDAGMLPSNHIRIGWYNLAYDKGLAPRAGERWRLKLKLKPPHGSANPGGFDYEMWLYQRGVNATGYVRDDKANQRLAIAPWWSVDALRQRIAEQIDSPTRPYAGLLMALAVGYTASMDDGQWSDLLVTGTNHLMSISGLHVSMVAGVVYWLTLKLLPISYIRRYAATPFAAGLGLLAATLYSALAGFAIPTQRTLVMLAVVLGAVVLRRPLQPMNALAAALVAILIMDPLAVLSPGFWFSFMAVAVIAYGYAGRIGSGNWWWRFGRIHWLVTLALFPLSLFLFQQTSIVAPLANLFLVPWVSFVVVPVLLLGALMLPISIFLAQGLFSLANSCLQLSWPALHGLAQLPLAKWAQPAPSFIAMLLALCGVLLLLAPRGFPVRWFGLLLLLPALLVPAIPVANGEFHATLIDVGQGLSVLVQTKNHALMFDAGPKFGDDADAGERMILPYLQHLGIGNVDMLMISNGDADHIGGAASLLSNLNVGELTGKNIEALTHANKSACITGQHWRWDGVEFYVLHPALNQIESERNNHSCVLKVSNGIESLLIAADIEKKIEKSLLAEQLAMLRSDVLIVPHHGSKTSSTEEFISAVQPHYALISAGYRNRYGHPKPEVVQRYRDAGTMVINTADSGAITMQFDQSAGLMPVLYRQHERHYWNAPLTH